jgi:predicted GNAT family acetyltransferase
VANNYYWRERYRQYLAPEIPMTRVRGMELFLPRFDARGRLALECTDWQSLEDDALKRIEYAPLLREGLRLLDWRRRIALLLRDGLELSIDQVAQLLALRLPEMVRLVHEARLRLRGLLDHLLRGEQMQIEFEQTEKRGSFFARRDGQRVAELVFERTEKPDVVVLTHTEVSPELRGQGVGHKLLDAAAAWSRNTGIKFILQCPFAKVLFLRDPVLRERIA